jgi:GNAT superfamily N-acetyltransferase
MRKLLYPDIDINNLFSLKKEMIIHPMNDIINSVIITQKSSNKFIDQVKIYDKSNIVEDDFKKFCYSVIDEEYGYKHNPIWHYDIDNANEVYNSDRSNYFVVKLGDEVVASAGIRPYGKNYDLFKDIFDKNTASVWRFFINRKYQQKGLEELLSKKIIDFALDNCFTKLYAHEQKTVPGALKRYLQSGFKIIHEDTDVFGTIHLMINLEGDNGGRNKN